MTSIQDTLDYFNRYFKGGPVTELQRHMRAYNGKGQLIKQNFHTVKISDPDIKDAIIGLFRSLFIPEDQYDYYFKAELTVFDLLLELNRNRIANVQTEYLIELINKQSRLRLIDFVLIGTWIASIAVVAATIPGVPMMVMALYALLTSASVYPIVGLIYSLSITAYTLFSHQFDKKIPLYNRIRNNFFVIASMALNITAYSIWISSAIGISPIVCGLFVASAGMHVIKEGVALLNELIIKFSGKHKYPEGDGLDATLNINIDSARHDFSFKKHRNAALINLATAIILAGVMTAWHFIPGGFILSTVAIISIGVIYGAKMLLTRKNDAMIRDGLQKELQTIEATHKEALKKLETEQSSLVIAVALSHSPASVPADAPAPVDKVIESVELKVSNGSMFRPFVNRDDASSDEELTLGY